MKIVMTYTGNFNIGSKAIHLEKGAIIDADPNDAARLIEGLCAEAYEEEKPKRKAVKDGDTDG